MEFMKQHRRAIYIALALCVVAAGVTGYLLTNRETPNQQASANQPVVDVKPPVVTPVTPDLPSRMEIDGEPLDPVAGLVMLLNKPLGMTCSHKEDGALVYDVLPDRWRRRICPSCWIPTFHSGCSRCCCRRPPDRQRLPRPPTRRCKSMIMWI